MMKSTAPLAALAALGLYLGACQQPEPEAGPGPGRLAMAAATVPDSFADTTLITGLSNPTAMDFAPDGRLFVTEQGGNLRVYKGGALLSAPFLGLSVDANGERGLLGVAFDPDFATNRYVYVYHTVPGSPAHNRVSRFTASASNPDLSTGTGDSVAILDLDPLSSATNHNGGAIHFGLDGKLYVAVGENANGDNAQTLANRLGKLLRINKDGSIPSDNPFYSTASGANRSIWALGLRNPFTFSVRPGSGRIFIDDVGQNTWEEIDDGIAGSNYGWPITEGATTDSRFRGPLYTYDHSNGACAIAGGTWYAPSAPQYPSRYVGSYFFSDYCAGWIRRYDPAANAVSDFASGIGSAVDLKTGPDGMLYYLSRSGGTVGRIRYTGNQAPAISAQPADQGVSAGQSATFTVSATGTAPLSYQWQRNGADIAGATGASYTLANAQAPDSGAHFRVKVSNAFGSATSREALLAVTANRPPKATITAPADSSLYSAGQVIAYSGSGADPEQGNLPASAFTWRIDFHHDTHLHPFLHDTSGYTSGSFTVPTTGETSANVWYRIHLTVTDAQGRKDSAYVDVVPRKVRVTLASSPAGLRLTLDGQPITTPYTFTGVVGIQRSLGAPSPQSLSGASYAFQAWSDGGAASHTLATPDTDRTLTATFARASAAIRYVSDLPWTDSANGWGPAERDRSNGETGAADGHTLTLNGKAYAKGVGAHAASDIRLNLGGCTDFNADVGVDDEVGNNGSVVFQVWADGSELIESPTLTGSSANYALHATVAGKSQLRLVVTDAGNGKAYDHADWADARLSCDSGQVYEAEDATLSGPVKATNHTGYSGSGFADYINNANDYVQWSVTVPASGAYTLEFRYANGGSGNRPLAISVNGVTVNSGLAFPVTGSWEAWSTVSVTANLNAGANTVRATATGASGANVDYLRVR